MCRAELVGLRDIADELKQHGGRAMAVCVDSPADSRRVVETDRLNFPILADVDHKTLRAYDLVHNGGGPKGTDCAIPAHLLIDRSGRIVWRHIARRFQDCPDPADEAKLIRPYLSK